MVSILVEQAVLQPGEVRMDATLADLGIDSLGLVEAVFAIEEAFGIQVPLNANDPRRRNSISAASGQWFAPWRS